MIFKTNFHRKYKFFVIYRSISTVKITWLVGMATKDGGFLQLAQLLPAQ